MGNDPAAIEITEKSDGVELQVRVVPGASRTRVTGVLGGALKVTVSAPAERGKANAAVVALLASVLDVPRRDVTIVAGQTRPRKRVRVRGRNSAQVRELVARELTSPDT